VRIVFMGTPAFAVPSLEALAAAGHEIAAVVTQPDRPKGRGLIRSAPPVAEIAQRLDLRVLQPAKARDPAFLRQLEALAPELVAVVAFGQILPRAILDLAPHGCVNVHPSLLPKYRGAAPIQHAILRDETITGVTTMILNERMDEGDLLLFREVPIEPGETAGELSLRLSQVGAALLVETVAGIAEGRLAPSPQDHARASYAPKVTKEDARIRWEEAARDVVNRVRAVTPSPGAFTTLGARVLKVWGARVAGSAEGAAPGTIVRAGDAGLVVAAGDGLAVALVELQLEGKKRLPAGEFARGTRLPPGDRLGNSHSARSG
jgi:methionyl-tRNA formyltransferase